MTLAKPADVFDREHEWSELSRYVTYAGSEATLGVVSGRRLERVRGLVADPAGPPPKLLLFSGRGVGAELVEAVRGRHDVELVDLDRLYTGD